MPMLIWNLTDYFHHKQKDLYYIHFKQAENIDFEGEITQLAGRQKLLDWFATNLPHIEIKPIFNFYSDSGILSAPYDGTVYVDFDEPSLQKFCAVWEDGNDNSIDPHFQCYHYPLEMYKEKYGGRIPDPNEFWENWESE